MNSLNTNRAIPQLLESRLLVASCRAGIGALKSETIPLAEVAESSARIGEKAKTDTR